MSVVSKIPYRATPAYFIGQFVAYRDEWVRKARTYSASGQSEHDRDMVRRCVGYARDYNRQMLREIERLHAVEQQQ